MHFPFKSYAILVLAVVLNSLVFRNPPPQLTPSMLPPPPCPPPLGSRGVMASWPICGRAGLVCLLGGWGAVYVHYSRQACCALNPMQIAAAVVLMGAAATVEAVAVMAGAGAAAGVSASARATGTAPSATRTTLPRARAALAARCVVHCRQLSDQL